MEDLQVIVDQTPGTARWNFDQLKASLEAGLGNYNIVYTADTIKLARQDVAMLRKLRASVEEHRKAIRAKCLEPYSIIEAQAKELVELIDRPIEAITRQMDEYEEERRKGVKAAIEEYMEKAFAGLPPLVAAKLRQTCYDARWENVTTSKKSWQTAIQEAKERTEKDVAAIGQVEEEFQHSAFAAYSLTLSLADAMAKVSELQHQRDISREFERKRREAQEKLQAVQDAQPTPPSTAPAIEAEPVIPGADGVKWTSPRVQRAYPCAQYDTPEAPSFPFQGDRAKVPDNARTIRFFGTPEQYKKLLGYIAYMGARYEEVVS